jgi:hypothetical protein
MYVSRAFLVALALVLSVLCIVAGCRMEMAVSEAVMHAPSAGTDARPPADSLNTERIYSPSLCLASDWQSVGVAGSA